MVKQDSITYLRNTHILGEFLQVSALFWYLKHKLNNCKMDILNGTNMTLNKQEFFRKDCGIENTHFFFYPVKYLKVNFEWKIINSCYIFKP